MATAINRPEVRRPVVHINLDNTDNCPIEQACVVCGTTAGLAVATYHVQVVVLSGVMCATVCENHAPALPPMAVLTMANRLANHCEHLAIDLGRMAAMLEEDPGWPGREAKA
jgi:hypothetical protein